MFCLLCFRFLDQTEGFALESRGTEFVPDNYDFEGDVKPESWFLNSFRSSKCSPNDDFMTHITTALNDLDDT